MGRRYVLNLECLYHIIDISIIQVPKEDKKPKKKQKEKEMYPRMSKNRQHASENGEKTALIFLHGLGPSATTACNWFIGPALGLSSSMNVVRCPKGPTKPTKILPVTFLPGSDKFVSSWFDFFLLPGASVLAPAFAPGENKEHLEEALETIEGIIEELMDEGIPSENIVVSGLSQGGVLTIYTALHSKHRLGGFLPIVTWVPRLRAEPLSSKPTPVNVDTPILHLNGLMDPIVPVFPAGSRSAAAMKEVFTNYELKNRIGTHLTTMGPQNIPTIRRWLRANTNINFGGLSNLLDNIPFFGSFFG